MELGYYHLNELGYCMLCGIYVSQAWRTVRGKGSVGRNNNIGFGFGRWYLCVPGLGGRSVGRNNNL